jgi:hypothetical protein
MKTTVAVAVLVLVAACGRSAETSDTAGGGADTGGMAGMTGMGGMSGMSGMGGMMSGAMMDSMAAHMRGMDTVSAAGLQAMLPMHRQMAGNMIAQMNREMRDMNMQGDAGWTALMDSVRQDLVRMPDMNGQRLRAFMPGHHERLVRLMQSHRAMMKM